MANDAVALVFKRGLASEHPVVATPHRSHVNQQLGTMAIFVAQRVLGAKTPLSIADGGVGFRGQLPIVVVDIFVFAVVFPLLVVESGNQELGDVFAIVGVQSSGFVAPNRVEAGGDDGID